MPNDNYHFLSSVKVLSYLLFTAINRYSLNNYFFYIIKERKKNYFTYVQAGSQRALGVSVPSPAEATASPSMVRPPSAGELPSPWVWVGVASVERRPAETSSPVGEASNAWGVVQPSSLAITVLILAGLSLPAFLRSRQILFALWIFGDGQQFFSLADEAGSDKAVAISFEMNRIRSPTSVVGFHHFAQVYHR